jgi:hypothetical protein
MTHAGEEVTLGDRAFGLSPRGLQQTRLPRRQQQQACEKTHCSDQASVSAFCFVEVISG